MAIKDVNELVAERFKLDLTGSDGNAFVILGYARRFGKQMGMSEEKVNELTDHMMAGDYENLITIFDNTFGDHVDLYR